MARKKKVKVEEQVKTEDVATYKGNVTIKVLHGNKAVKTIKTSNTGFMPLFEFLMYCLAGSYLVDKLPRYLRVFNVDNTELTTNAILSNSTQSYEKTSSSCSVTISFVIPYSILTSAQHIKSFKLYSQENSSYNKRESPSAEIILDNEISVSTDANLLVAWKMTVENK